MIQIDTIIVSLRVLNMTNTTAIRVFTGHSFAVLSFVVLPTGELLSGSIDKTIKIWNVTSGQVIQTLKGH